VLVFFVESSHRLLLFLLLLLLLLQLYQPFLCSRGRFFCCCHGLLLRPLLLHFVPLFLLTLLSNGFLLFSLYSRLRLPLQRSRTLLLLTLSSLFLLLLLCKFRLGRLVLAPFLQGFLLTLLLGALQSSLMLRLKLLVSPLFLLHLALSLQPLPLFHLMHAVPSSDHNILLLLVFNKLIVVAPTVVALRIA